MGRNKKGGARQLEILSCRVTQQVYAEVKKIAEGQEIGMAQIMRTAIREYVEHLKNKQAA